MTSCFSPSIVGKPRVQRIVDDEMSADHLDQGPMDVGYKTHGGLRYHPQLCGRPEDRRMAAGRAIMLRISRPNPPVTARRISTPCARMDLAFRAVGIVTKRRNRTQT